MRILLCGIILLMFSCKSEVENVPTEINNVNIDELQKDFKIPIELWSKMADDKHAAAPKPEEHAPAQKPKEGGHGEHGKEADDGPAPAPDHSKNGQIIFVPAKLTLTAKNEGVLKNAKTVIHFPRGGGTVDLSDWTTGENGTYYMKFEMEEVEQPEEVKTFFLSQTRKRKIENEIIGMGCNKYVEFGEKYFNAMGEKGLAVNTTRNRDVSVTGGRWFFVAKQTGKVYVSQITIADATKKDLFCEDAIWNVN